MLHLLCAISFFNIYSDPSYNYGTLRLGPETKLYVEPLIYNYLNECVFVILRYFLERFVKAMENK